MKHVLLLWSVAFDVVVLAASFDRDGFKRAVARGDARVVYQAVRCHDIDVNMYFDKDSKETLLLFAAWSDNADMVRALLTDPGVDVTCHNVAGETAYFWALEHNNTEMIALLDEHNRRYPPPYTRGGFKVLWDD